MASKTREQRIMQAVACPTCGVGVGEECVHAHQPGHLTVCTARRRAWQQARQDAEAQDLRTVEGHLSRIAGHAWPGAVVYLEPDGLYTLERPGLTPLWIGGDREGYKGALAALKALAASVR